jgi:hypothetical protein
VLAAEIPDGYLVAFLSAGLPAVLLLMAWIVRELNRTSSRLDVMDQREKDRQEDVRDHESRLRHLERVGR